MLSSEDSDELSPALQLLAERLDVFLRSPQVEVQERATALKALLTTLGAWSNAQQCRFISSFPSDGSRAHGPREPQGTSARAEAVWVGFGSRPFAETTLTAFLEQPDPATKPCAFGEADETFDTGFDDDDAFAETGGFYDIKGSDDESSEGEKKKKKKKVRLRCLCQRRRHVDGLGRWRRGDFRRGRARVSVAPRRRRESPTQDKKKKKKSSSRLNLDHYAGPVLHRRRARPARRRFRGRRARRAPVEEGVVQGQKRRRRRSRGKLPEVGPTPRGVQ